jgi:hypothetical protein
MEWKSDFSLSLLRIWISCKKVYHVCWRLGMQGEWQEEGMELPL